MADGFNFDASGVLNGLADLELRTNAKSKAYANTMAKDFERYAKQNRPWHDRSKRAREGLTGYTKSIPKGYRIVIAHTVDYGIDLEMKYNKRYAILEPTVRLKGAEAVKGLRNLF